MLDWKYNLENLFTLLAKQLGVSTLQEKKSRVAFTSTHN